MIAPESRIPRNTPERLATNYTNSHEIFSARQWVYAPRIANGAFSKRVIRLSFFRGIRGQAFSNLLQCHVSLARGITSDLARRPHFPRAMTWALAISCSQA